MKLSDVDQKFVAKTARAIRNCKMGGDPEFFIANKRGKVLNADRFFPGKENPLHVGYTSSECRLFFDGIQGEMSYAPNTCRETVIARIKAILMEAQRIAKDDHHILLKPSSKIDRKIIENAHPEARIFGCLPDFNAYTRATNTCEMDASRHPFRYAGGHLHFGISPNAERDPNSKMYKGEISIVNDPSMHLRVVKMMDLFISIVTLPLDNAPGSKRRRTKYGKAGCFRPTPYGVEYRTPSCWWIKSPVTVSLVYALGRMAWSITAAGLDEEFYRVLKISEEDVRGIIDESNIEASNELWKKIRAYLGTMFNPGSNPLNIGTMVKRIGSTPNGNVSLTTIITMAGPDLNLQRELGHYFKYVPRRFSTKKYPIVHGLALVDYLRQGADEEFIDKNVRKEWNFPSELNKSDVREVSGGLIKEGLLTKLGKSVSTSKDFIKFQASLMKELGCEHSHCNVSG